MTKITPFVTVCVTTKNRPKLCLNAIQHIIAQDYRNFEVCVVDDGSTLENKRYLTGKLPRDSRIRFFYNEKSMGLAAARNIAINNAVGKYFSFCDDDDLWQSDFLSKMVAATFINPKSSFAGGNLKRISNGHMQQIRPPMFSGTFKDAIYDGYTPPVASQFYLLDDIRAVCGYNVDISSGVDHDLWIRLGTINANLSFVSDAFSIPNDDENIQRLTNSFAHRYEKIKLSLSIWQKPIQNFYDPLFEKHFANEYKYYLFQRFCIVFIRQRTVINLIKHVSLNGNMKFYYRFIGFIIKKFRTLVGGKSRTMAPAFRPFKR